MTEHIRIAIRDSTDSHTIGFFDNESGIRFNEGKLRRFLKGAASYATIKYSSKDIDSIKAGCRLSFRYKDVDYWLTVHSLEKKGFSTTIIAYSLSLEANKEDRIPYKASQSMPITHYIDKADPEKAFVIGINEVADKSLKLEWTGTNTMLDRLYSIANYFEAELEFITELNDNYSLKRHVINIYRRGNLGKSKTGLPVRVGKDLKVINFSENIDNLYTAVRATGKDGLTMNGLSRPVYDSEGKILFSHNDHTIYAEQSKNRFPSIVHKMTDSYVTKDFGQTEYTTKESLYGYMLSELKKLSMPTVTYETEGKTDAEIGDTLTLIDDFHYDPPLYVQARVSELEDDFLDDSKNASIFTNFVRKSSAISVDLEQRVNQLLKEAERYTLNLATSSGTVFKNGQGISEVLPTLKRGTEVISGASFAWYVNGALSKTGDTFEVLASTVEGTTVIKVEAIISGQVVASTEVTFTNVSDGTNGLPGKPGADGKTSYWHTAYANSADGKVDFHLTDNAGRRYFGHYTDYTLADSTDSTKYKWVDMAAPAEKIVKEQAVLKTDVKVTDEGIVTSASKTVNGQTIASMIAQRAEWVEIIAQLLKIKADMIVDGAITADKLNVAKLSAVTSDLGIVTAGNMLLQRSFKAGSSVIPAYKYPDYKTGLFVDNHGLLVNGMPVQKTSSETMASDMPIVAMTAGEVRFSRVDITENLERLLHEGLSDQDFGSIQFGRDPDGRNALAIQVNGQVYLKGQNYTDWTVSTVNRNVRWKVQGNLVIVDYDVTFPTSGTKHIVTIPTKYISKALMLTVKAWRVDNTKDRNAQLNAEGDLHILEAEANQRYCGQIVWAY